MFKVKYSLNGLLKETCIMANDVESVNQIITNMYSGNETLQIIDIRRVIA